MSNLPQSMNNTNPKTPEQLVLDLCNPDLRENALLELSEKAEELPNLGLLLWNSFGTITTLLDEILSIYKFLSPPTMNHAQSSRVCNTLILLGCVASHPATRTSFFNAQMIIYLFPLIKTASERQPFEYLRLTTLGVISGLLKFDNANVISYLLSAEIIPLCLTAIEMGSELSKVIATHILEKILLDDVGLEYICYTRDRFCAVGRVLSFMLAKKPSSRLLILIIKCYLRLSDHPRACEALRSCLPDLLRDSTFISSCLHEDDASTRKLLHQLLVNVQRPTIAMQAHARSYA